MKKVRLFLAGVLASSMSFALTTATVLAADNFAGDVEGLEVIETYNNAVELEWNAAPDADHEGGETAGYIVHYGTSKVTEQGQTFDENMEVGDVTSYVVEGLEEGTTYYFSVVAYDSNNPANESANWSNQVSATPEADMDPYNEEEDNDNGEAPKVSSVEAVDMKTVRVTFSEAVKLPKDSINAFTVENQDNFEVLTVEASNLDPNDDKVVVLKTADQEVGVEYKLTAGVEIQDAAGNPIVSGTSDTGVFTGSDSEPGDEPFRIVSVEVVDNQNIVVDFTRSVDLSTDPSTNFEIVAANDETVTAPVNSVTLGNGSYGEDTSVVIGTELEEDRDYVVKVNGLTDVDGNEMDMANRSFDFTNVLEGVKKPLPDETNDDDHNHDEDEHDHEDQNLAESGPGVIGGLVALSLGLGGIVGRKKK